MVNKLYLNKVVFKNQISHFKPIENTWKYKQTRSTYLVLMQLTVICKLKFSEMFYLYFT